MRKIIITLAVLIALQVAFSGCILVDPDYYRHEHYEHHEEHGDHD